MSRWEQVLGKVLMTFPIDLGAIVMNDAGREKSFLEHPSSGIEVEIVDVAVGLHFEDGFLVIDGDEAWVIQNFRSCREISTIRVFGFTGCNI